MLIADISEYCFNHFLRAYFTVITYQQYTTVLMCRHHIHQKTAECTAKLIIIIIY